MSQLNEEILAKIVSMGFSEGDAVNALKSAEHQTLESALEQLGGSKETTDNEDVEESDPSGDESDESEIIYSEDDDEDIVFYDEEEEADISSSAVARTSFTAEDDFQVWTEASVLEKQNGTAQRVSAVLAIPVERAVLLLIHFKWNEDKLMTHWMENPDGTATKVGVETEAMRLNPPSLDPEKQHTCLICYDDEVSADDMTIIPCGHAFCKDCWVGNLQVMIKEGQSLEIECMFPKCKLKIPGSVVEKLVDAQTWEKYRHFQTKQYVSSNPYVRWCPAAGCNRAIRITEDASNTVKCSCGNEFCFGCSEQPHPPATCDEVRRWAKKCNDDSETANWITANTKACPGCHTSIEKNGGCNHVTCFKCSHEFCWVCNGAWAAHNGNYSCNRYDEAKQATMDASSQALSRYLHYFQRYVNHENSREFEGKLLRQAEDKMKDMQCFEGATWIDVQYIAKAAETLVMARRILMYTYVKAFYLPDGADKNLFEFQQEAVETSTEELARILEQDIDKLQKIEVLNLAQKVQRSVTSLLENNE